MAPCLSPTGACQVLGMGAGLVQGGQNHRLGSKKAVGTAGERTRAGSFFDLWNSHLNGPKGFLGPEGLPGSPVFPGLTDRCKDLSCQVGRERGRRSPGHACCCFSHLSPGTFGDTAEFHMTYPRKDHGENGHGEEKGRSSTI